MEGEVVFTPVFQDDYKMTILETHRVLCSSLVANYLVSKIVRPADETKLNGMTCLEPNQFTRDVMYKVSAISIHLLFDNLRPILVSL